jgi:hypothetical protein
MDCQSETLTMTKLKRLLSSIADYRRGLRLLTGQPKLDVVFICPLRDENERAALFHADAALSQQSGPRLYIKEVAGQIRYLNFTAAELAGCEGRALAKQAVIQAVRWAEQHGAKVVLLAGAIQGLFGRDGLALKQLFPSMLFTTGNNGITQLLCADVDQALRLTGLKYRQPRILILGADTRSGQALLAHLVANGQQVLGVAQQPEACCPDTGHNTSTEISQDLQPCGPVDLVVHCLSATETSPKNSPSRLKLATTTIAALRRTGRKVVWLELAGSAMATQPLVAQCQSLLLPLTGGNAYAAGLHFVLGAFSYRPLRLAQGQLFGEFAEAMALFYGVYHDHNHRILNRDWFEVSPYNQALLAEAFYSLRIGLPQPHYAAQPVTDFELALSPLAVARTLVNQVVQPTGIKPSLS